MFSDALRLRSRRRQPYSIGVSLVTSQTGGRMRTTAETGQAPISIRSLRWRCFGSKGRKRYQKSQRRRKPTSESLGGETDLT